MAWLPGQTSLGLLVEVANEQILSVAIYYGSPHLGACEQSADGSQGRIRRVAEELFDLRLVWQTLAIAVVSLSAQDTDCCERGKNEKAEYPVHFVLLVVGFAPTDLSVSLSGIDAV
jgi:hypothetical protein